MKRHVGTFGFGNRVYKLNISVYEILISAFHRRRRGSRWVMLHPRSDGLFYGIGKRSGDDIRPHLHRESVRIRHKRLYQGGNGTTANLPYPKATASQIQRKYYSAFSLERVGIRTRFEHHQRRNDLGSMHLDEPTKNSGRTRRIFTITGKIVR